MEKITSRYQVQEGPSEIIETPPQTLPERKRKIYSLT